jgi:hypothetical protein
MTVGWQQITNPLSFDCGICKEVLDENVIAHDNLGIKHPFHKKCVIEWLKINSSCPVCRASLDTSSLFSWQDRMVWHWNRYKRTIAQPEIACVIAIGILFGAVLKMLPNEQGYNICFIFMNLNRLAFSAVPAAIAGSTVSSLVTSSQNDAAITAFVVSCATACLFY